MNKKSAESKLLNLIEASSANDADSSAPAKKEAAPASKTSTLQYVNYALIVMLLLSMALLGYVFYSGSESLKNIAVFRSQNVFAKKTFDASILERMPSDISNIIVMVKNRNIFKPFESKPKANQVQISNNNKRIIERISDLKLVGIAWLDRVDTASAMIEDVEKGVTYFLRTNESIKDNNRGDITVKTIYADSVALGYKDEEIIISYDKPQM